MEQDIDGRERAAIGELRRSVGGLITWNQDWLDKKHSESKLFRAMRNSFAVTMASLTSPEVETRMLALDVLNAFFPTHEIADYLEIFEKLAFTDTESEVRENAIPVLARIAKRHSLAIQKSIGKRIAAVVLDESEYSRLRRRSYRALCTLSNEYEVRIKSCDDIDFPHDVDWGYVRSW